VVRLVRENLTIDCLRFRQSAGLVVMNRGLNRELRHARLTNSVNSMAPNLTAQVRNIARTAHSQYRRTSNQLDDTSSTT
jgi:hypothetical protein